MPAPPMSVAVGHRLRVAAHKLGTANPLGLIKPPLDRTFSLPDGDSRYAATR